MKEKVAEALRKAKDLMNSSGAHWTRYDLRARRYDEEEGVFIEDDFSYCSLGAIYQVTGVDLDKLVWYDEEEGNMYAEGVEAEAALLEGDVELREALILALAEEINRSGHQQYRGSWYEKASPRERAAYTITGWNDGNLEWDPVAEMFEKAAQRVEASDG